MSVQSIFTEIADREHWPPVPERQLQRADASELQPVDARDLVPATVLPWTPPARDEAKG